MSYKIEVIADSSGKWCGNGIRLATEPEAQAYAVDLAGRWTAVRDVRVVPCDDPASHTFTNGNLVGVASCAQCS